MVDPFEEVKDKLMTKLPSQTEFVLEAMDVVLQTMVTPKGLKVSPAATQKSLRTSKDPTQGIQTQEKRKRGTFEEENLPSSELAIKRPTAHRAPEVTTIVKMPMRQKEIKQEQERYIPGGGKGKIVREEERGRKEKEN